MDKRMACGDGVTSSSTEWDETQDSPETQLPEVAVKEEPGFTAADSNSASNSKTFIPCKVCGDKASGYHYGVTSCEGCKGFFRRSIQKQIEYRCLREGKCLVIRLNRNRCQYCRFKKCLAVGMSRDSVRYGRVPKRSREKTEETRVISQSEPEPVPQPSPAEIEAQQLAMYDTILSISQAHHAHCAYVDDKLPDIKREPAIFTKPELQSSPGDGADSLETQKIVMWQHFAFYITPCIQRVVEFAKRIPGFSDLTQDDQLILIKQGFFEIWLVHVSKLVTPVENTITFSNGFYINRQQMELIFDHEFVAAVFTFVLSMSNLNLSDTETGLFSAAVLFNSDRPGIYDHKAIQQQQEKVLDALKLQASRHHMSEPNFFFQLCCKLPEVQALGSSHGLHLQWFRSHWTRLTLPPLFAEIFDIPKPQEETEISQN